MEVVTVVGARPQFIKAAVVSRNIRSHNSISETIIHTGQHYDANMSDIFFKEMQIPEPDYNLGIGGGTHGENTGRMIEEIERILINKKPSIVLVYGDTDSTLAGSLAASKLNIPVAHVEAGLRSFNRKMPEEINRILTDHISAILFAPTETAIENLKAEGIKESHVHYVGDVMYDASIFYSELAERKSKILDDLNLVNTKYILATIHRAENVDNGNILREIFRGLSKSTKRIILPLHPRTATRIKEFNITIPDIISVIDPVGYLDMIKLEKSASLILTDSGGVQKEAYFHRVPCVTLRDETEWVELVNSKWNRLCPVDSKIIGQKINANYKNGLDRALYGNGEAGQRISETLLAILNA